jgi:alanine dehydrogenase
VVVLGAGVVAEFATRTAIGLGAEVRIFDNNIYKIMRLQNQVGRQLHTSVFNLYHLQQELLTADVAIGAIHSKSGRAPMVVSEDMVRRMKQGSVIIDVSIDQGGCFETSQMTSHEHPTFEKYGVIHYCVPNIASRVARSASLAISNIITSILLRADATENMEGFLHDNLGLRHGIYMYKGCLTNVYLGERFQMKSTDLDLLITSEY